MSTVVVDLDGTLIEDSGEDWSPHTFRSPLPGAEDALVELDRVGVDVQVWTCRLVTAPLLKLLSQRFPVVSCVNGWGVPDGLASFPSSPWRTPGDVEISDLVPLYGEPVERYCRMTVLLHRGGKPWADVYLDDRCLGMRALGALERVPPWSAYPDENPIPWFSWDVAMEWLCRVLPEMRCGDAERQS